jgi:hypothetical protein
MKPVLKFLSINGLEADAVTGPDREVSLVGLGDAERGPAQKVPSSGRLARIDTGLPARDRNRAGRNLEPWLVAPGQTAECRNKVARVGKSLEESNGEDVVNRGRVEVNHPFELQAELVCDLMEILPVVKNRDQQELSLLSIIRPRLHRTEPFFESLQAALLGIDEDCGRTVSQDDVGRAGKSRCTDGRNPPGSLSLVCEVGQESAITKWLK